MGILKIILFSILFSACTTSTRTLLTHRLPREQTNYKKVQVFFGAPPKKARPLGLVTVSRDGENATWAVEILKMEAAEIGADAITNLEMNYSPGFFPLLRLQGLAVKYENR